MLRWLAPLFAGYFAAAIGLPTLVLLQFEVDRARIERELCVQRDRIEGMRTCHGECQLSKRFKALEREAEQGFPAERVQVKYEPVVVLVDDLVIPEVIAGQLSSTDGVFATLEGYGIVADPVPWG